MTYVSYNTHRITSKMHKTTFYAKCMRNPLLCSRKISPSSKINFPFDENFLPSKMMPVCKVCGRQSMQFLLCKNAYMHRSA